MQGAQPNTNGRESSRVRPFTLIGFYIKDDEPAPLYVHAHNACTAEEARQQMQAGFPFNAVFQTYDGHLMPFDGNGTAPLHLLGPGKLSETGPNAPAIAVTERPRPVVGRR